MAVRLPSLIALLGLWLSASGCGALQREASAELPSLQLERLDGGAWDLRDESGHVVVLQFFASFDNFSLALATALERIHIRYAPRGVRVIGVAMDPGEGRPRRRVVEEFCALANLTFDVVLATDAVGAGDTELGEIPTIPATVIFGRDSRPVASATGLFHESELEELLDRLTSR